MVTATAKVDLAQVDNSEVGLLITNITEVIGELDSRSSIKAAYKTVIERIRESVIVEEIYHKVTGKKYKDYPAIRIQNDSV